MRLGVLGGTFDPVHIGHLILAEQTRDALRLDKVLLIPASRPPHKPIVPVSPYEIRLRLVRLAVRGIPGLEASDLEKDSSHPSYSVDTLRLIRKRNPGLEELWLLLGEDAMAELDTWKEPEEILRLARLAVYGRPGCRHRPSDSLPKGLLRLDRIDGPLIALSSSELRQRLASGMSVRFLIPELVRACIEREGYYGPNQDGAAG